MYNMSSGKWENVNLASEIGDLITVFSPASAESNGTVGLVPAPQAGQQDLYLKGDGSWANPTEAVVLEVETLKTSVDKLIGTDKYKQVKEIFLTLFKNLIVLITILPPFLLLALNMMSKLFYDSCITFYSSVRSFVLFFP